MKFLLAVIMTTVFAGSAFAACSVATPEQCTDEASCKNLSTDAQKWNFSGSKCTSSDGPVATNCMEGQGGARAPKQIGSDAPAVNNTKDGAVSR